MFGAVPGEQHRATGELSLGLGNRVERPDVKVELALGNAIGPKQRHEIGLLGSVESDGQWQEALARCRVGVEGVQHRPVAGETDADVGADAGSVRTHLVRFRATGGRDGEEGMAARPGRPELQPFGACRHQCRSVGRF